VNEKGIANNLQKRNGANDRWQLGLRECAHARNRRRTARQL